MGSYKVPDSSINFAQIEQKIREYWKQNNIFDLSIKNKDLTGEFIFYDGPPFANGLPHYGHLLTSFVKDIFARYQTSIGNKTERRFGWDCHGLPAEMETEKQLGVSGRSQIESFGIDNFNQACKTGVMKYTSEWQDYIVKSGRWVDFKNDYRTMDTSYMNSVIWAFNELYKKGLLYQKYRVMPYSWKCQTPLSNFETRLDNSYRQKESKAITVKFTLKDNRKIMVWTTTPWTLPSNLALAVNKDIDYIELNNNIETIIIAKNLASKYQRELNGYFAGLCGLEEIELSDQKQSIYKQVRRTVFVDEMSLPQTFQWDGEAEEAKYTHYLYKNIATVRVLFDKDSATISRFAILPKHRNKGLGTKILQKILSTIAISKPNIKNVWVSPLDHKTIDVCKLYTKLGFKPVDKEYIENGIKYKKALLDIANFKIPTFKGSNLAGLEYYPLFGYFSKNKNCFKILEADFVTTEDGTGIVHLAPGFGEDDQTACEKHGIEVVCPIDDGGKFVNISDLPIVEGNQISTERLYAKPLDKDDFDLYFTLYSNPKTREHYKHLTNHIFTKEDAEEYFNGILFDKNVFSLPKFAVFEKQTNIFIGIVSLGFYDPDKHIDYENNIELSYLFLPEFFGKGYATEITSAVSNWAFKTYPAKLINIAMVSENTASAHVAKKLGAKLAFTGTNTYKKWNNKIKEGVTYQEHLYHLKNEQNSTPKLLSLNGRVVLEEKTNEKGHKSYDGVNDDIIKYLKIQGSWVKTDQYLHNYPHCWRTDTPLIYKAVSSWYVEVTKFKNKMVELNSGKINYFESERLYGEIVSIDKHFDDVFKIMSDPEVRTYYYFMDNHILNAEQVKDLFAYYKNQYEQFGLPRFAVFEKQTNKFVGVTGFCFYDHKNESFDNGILEISYILDKCFWGKGYATEMASEMQNIMFKRFNVNKIALATVSDNLGSKKIADKLGFQIVSKKISQNPKGSKTKHYEEHYYEKQRPTDIKYEPLEGINWIPNHIRDGQFGKWLENARDWSISRNRFWGCPVPIWTSNSGATYSFGSIAELESFFECKVTDLHRPYIDSLECSEVSITLDRLNITKAINILNSNKICHSLVNETIYLSKHNAFKAREVLGNNICKDEWLKETGFKITRVTDVLDCWFESGSMPFASIGYPFADNSVGDDGNPKNFPADFIVEYVAQTRGWFYTMMVLSTALFDKAPFKNCICHGVILDANGQKLSKRLKNYPDPMEVFDKISSDAMRWFVVSSPVMNGGDLLVDKDAAAIKDVIRLVIKPIYNSYTFFAMYANADKITAQEDYSSQNVMDIYILSKLKTLSLTVAKSMDSYSTQPACAAIVEFMEILNNWYIRRTKERFWKSEKDQDKALAYNTLYTVLLNICKISSPLLPHLTEEIYLNLTQHI